MTARRKDDGTMEVLGLGAKTWSFRTVVIALLLSQHPLGRQLLGTFGFRFPDEQRVAVVAEKADKVNDKVAEGLIQVAEISKDMTHVKEDLERVKTDLTTVRTDLASVKTKQDKLEIAFTGFQVDFESFRKSHQ